MQRQNRIADIRWHLKGYGIQKELTVLDCHCISLNKCVKLIQRLVITTIYLNPPLILKLRIKVNCNIKYAGWYL